MKHRRYWLALAATAALPHATWAAEPDKLAPLFGARETVADASLSPDGKHVAIVTAGPGHSDVVIAVDATTGDVTRVGNASGDPLRLRSCGWSSNSRLVCKFVGFTVISGVNVGYTRTMGFDMDGKNPLYLGRRAGSGSLRLNQFDGDVIDWRDGDGSVLMTRDFVPEEQTGAAVNRSRDGLGVELVDTATGKASMVEAPSLLASAYLADGRGTVRIKAEDQVEGGTRVLNGTTLYSYRSTGSRGWKTFSKIGPNGAGLTPVAVDGTRNTAFASQPLDGRLALYSVALDGSMKTELVSSNPQVDVASVVTIGRHGRVIGATYVTDKRQVDYFDPEYKRLAASLAKALPKTPLIRFLDATADEGKLLIFAGSDVDPGRLYLFNKADRHLDEVTVVRPELKDMPLAEMKPVTFQAQDGAAIPGYLTLPPGGACKGLPAIVMPHGGPSYRDEWGFDWLAQYFAQSGYAVLQPNFRGSSGYGDAWYAKNGFRSWQTAIGDIADAGRWLVKEGIADPAKLAIVGWSYGGYAALQANVVDPDLFKAVVAIAPVTDLGELKRDADDYTSRQLVAQQIGSGSAVAAGSPARHAERFKAPVLMFHGDRDLNVDIGQSRRMDAALRRAGGTSTLVVFPKLDHQLDDSDARTTMLDRANAFLRGALKL